MNKKCVVNIMLALALILGSYHAAVAMTFPGNDKGPVAGLSQDLIRSILTDKILATGIESVCFSADGRQIRLMRGQLSEPLAGELTEAGRQYIIEHRSLLNVPEGIDATSLVLLRNEALAGVTHLSFGLDFGGRRLHQTEIALHIGRDRIIHLLTGSFPVFSESRSGNEISSDVALKLAMEATECRQTRGESQTDRVMTVRENSLIPAILVHIPSAQPLGDFTVLIDGLAGDVLDIENEMQFFNRPVGRGSVYTVHPHKSQVTVEPLPHLIDGTLKGKFVDVINEDFPPASSPTREFIYDPDDTHFDEVNVYYHINRIHDFFAGFGYTKLDRPLKVMVHNETNYDKAFYSPKHDIICFGDGNISNDFAKEDSIIYHEYSHAALQQIVALKYKGESGALNEGQADYFACSLSNDPVIGEYVESKTTPGSIRKLINKTHYPESNWGNVHVACMVWGASLWDLRNALGAKTADKLIFVSHYYLKAADASFFDGYQAILAADKDLFAGANKVAITKVFTDRGIAAGTVYGPDFNARDLSVIREFLVCHGELN